MNSMKDDAVELGKAAVVGLTKTQFGTMVLAILVCFCGAIGQSIWTSAKMMQQNERTSDNIVSALTDTMKKIDARTEATEAFKLTVAREHAENLRETLDQSKKLDLIFEQNQKIIDLLVELVKREPEGNARSLSGAGPT